MFSVVEKLSEAFWTLRNSKDLPSVKLRFFALKQCITDEVMAKGMARFMSCMLCDSESISIKLSKIELLPAFLNSLSNAHLKKVKLVIELGSDCEISTYFEVVRFFLCRHLNLETFEIISKFFNIEEEIKVMLLENQKLKENISANSKNLKLCLMSFMTASLTRCIDLQMLIMKWCIIGGYKTKNNALVFPILTSLPMYLTVMLKELSEANEIESLFKLSDLFCRLITTLSQNSVPEASSIICYILTGSNIRFYLLDMHVLNELIMTQFVNVSIKSDQHLIYNKLAMMIEPLTLPPVLTGKSCDKKP